ncbi:hypothetical protein WMY93_020236 [Mugilogobius chulae]|uniref:L1 transposable element RRM domain-containing protein n=1 Tax=Mugilogobius chulae TaxID=88201 RepID=A0AAW0NHM7_9GOBI
MTRPKIKKQEKETNADLERAEYPELALAEHDSANYANTGSTKMDDEPNEVLRAIRDLKTTMNDRFNILEESLSSTKASVADLSARTHEVEKASSDHENRLSLVESTLAAIRSENNSLRQKVVDLEARSRRQNIKIVGLPEKIENGRMEDFLSRFLPQLLGPDHFDKPVMVDRAHRLGVRAPEAGGRPRVTIARIHSCQTKEKILQLARQGFPLRHNDKPVYICPDYPAEITKQRQAFVDVRKRLEAGGARLSTEPVTVERGGASFRSPSASLRHAPGLSSMTSEHSSNGGGGGEQQHRGSLLLCPLPLLQTKPRPGPGLDLGF